MKTFKNLFYIGLSLVGIPVGFILLMSIFSALGPIKNKSTQELDGTKVVDTIKVKVYDTVKIEKVNLIEKIKWVEKVEVDSIN